MNLAPNQTGALEHFKATNFIGIAWHKPGTGKTRLALSAVLSIRPFILNTIIVCPKKAIAGWQAEIVKCNFWLPYKIYSADSFNKLDTSRDFSKSFLIVDELYYFANPNAARTKALKKRSQFFPHRIALSGTIMPTRDNITIWGQLSAMNLEHHLARNATEFRSLYQTRVFGPFGAKQKNKPGSVDKIIEKIRRHVHVYFPENEDRNIREVVEDIALTKEQLTKIAQVREEYSLQIHSGVVLDYKFATEVLFTVCKITNGWINSEKGGPIAETYQTNKLKFLEGILESLIADGQKVVIWCNFRNDVLFLQDALKYRTVRFWGGEDFDEAGWVNGKYDVVLATCSSGASVNYFGNIQYGIYYSLPFKLKDFVQSKGRHERKDSTHSGAFYYYLISNPPSFDGKILRRLNANQQDEEKMLEGFAKEFLNI